MAVGERLCERMVGTGAPLAGGQLDTALEELFVQNYPVVAGFVRRRVRQDVVDDIVATTFEEATRRFIAGDGATIELPWLLTVARRRVVDFWRKTTRERSLLESICQEVDRSSLVIHDESPFDGRLAAMLGELSSDSRDALLLRYVHGHSVGEVADELGRTYKGDCRVWGCQVV